MRILRRIVLLLLLVLPSVAGTTLAAEDALLPLRIAYLDDAGSALILLAAGGDEFRDVGLVPTLIKVESAGAAWRFLRNGQADVVAVDALSALDEISRDGSLVLYSGSGHLGEQRTDGEGVVDAPPARIVLVTLRERLVRERRLFNPVVEALVRAYCRSIRKPDSLLPVLATLRNGSSVGERVLVADPNPGYDGLDRLWKEQGLQRRGQPRDYLSSHINEEYYCDSLYLLLDRSPEDPDLRRLLSRAVCVPNCCTPYRASPAAHG